MNLGNSKYIYVKNEKNIKYFYSLVNLIENIYAITPKIFYCRK